MKKEERIQWLKDLVLVRRVALNNDFIPSQDEIDIEAIFDDEIHVKDREQGERLKESFRAYSGYDADSIVELIIHHIKEL